MIVRNRQMGKLVGTVALIILMASCSSTDRPSQAKPTYDSVLAALSNAGSSDGALVVKDIDEALGSPKYQPLALRGTVVDVDDGFSFVGDEDGSSSKIAKFGSGGTDWIHLRIRIQSTYSSADQSLPRVGDVIRVELPAPPDTDVDSLNELPTNQDVIILAVPAERIFPENSSEYEAVGEPVLRLFAQGLFTTGKTDEDSPPINENVPGLISPFLDSRSASQLLTPVPFETPDPGEPPLDQLWAWIRG